MICPSCEWPAGGIGFQLAVKPACDLVSLGHIHLDGCLILGTNDVVAQGEFSWHIQVHELSSVILPVKAVSPPSRSIMNT